MKKVLHITDDKVYGEDQLLMHYTRAADDIIIKKLLLNSDYLNSELELVKETGTRVNNIWTDDCYPTSRENLPRQFSELLKETSYADLLMMNIKSQLTPDTLLEELLRRCACPVLLLPKESFLPKQLLFAYDNHELSIYALKQFSYLMPYFFKLPLTIIYTIQGEVMIQENKAALEELFKQLLTDYSFFKLEFSQKNYFSCWLEEVEAPMLITGTFGRSTMPAFLKRSFVADVLAENKIPIFIAQP